MLKTIFLSLTRIIIIAFIVLLPVVSASPATTLPATTFSCACCAEPGEWFERTGKLEAYEIDELRRVEFANTASPYLNAVGFEDLKGLSLEYESYKLTSLLKPSLALTLTFKGERGETGSLTLSLPRVATLFGSDLHDSPEGSAGPILYKEWRFKGMVTGSGFFKKGITPGTKFHLILQGRGNNCLSSSDFANWRLDIAGPRASYAFYGSLKNP
jgi:hypothetical protein